MRVTVIGCSGSFPGPDSPASCYLVEADGFAMLLELGSGALGVLQQFRSPYEIDAVLLSHLHPDHCMDMCGFYVARNYRPDGRAPRIPVYGPADTGPQMSRAYGLPTDDGMDEAFHFRPLPGGTWEIGPFTVSAVRTPHPVEAYAFRIEANGRVLAYSGDTGESSALVDIARDAHLFLCEASFLDGPNLPPDLHLTAREAGEHATRAGVDRLVLTHLVPWNDSGRSLVEAKGSGFAGPIELAHVGATYDV